MTEIGLLVLAELLAPVYLYRLNYRVLQVGLSWLGTWDVLGDVNAINTPLTMIRSIHDLRNRPQEVTNCKIYRESNQAADYMVFIDLISLLQE